VAADKYRNYVALTPEKLVSGLDQLARLVRRDGYLALQGDESFFDVLRKQRAAWAAAFSPEVRARQLRPKAEAAFREQRFHDASELYGQILPCLSPAERLKLDLARRRSERSSSASVERCVRQARVPECTQRPA
jgi:hypothetical protein